MASTAHDAALTTTHYPAPLAVTVRHAAKDLPTKRERVPSGSDPSGPGFGVAAPCLPSSTAIPSAFDDLRGVPTPLRALVIDVIRLYTTSNAHEARSVLEGRYSRSVLYESNVAITFARSSLATLITLLRWVLPPPAAVHKLQITTADAPNAYPALGGVPQQLVKIQCSLIWPMRHGLAFSVFSALLSYCGATDSSIDKNSSLSYGTAGTIAGGSTAVSKRRSLELPICIVLTLDTEHLVVQRHIDHLPGLYWVPALLKGLTTVPLLLVSTSLSIC